MFEGMDFGMFGIDPNSLQRALDTQGFNDTAYRYAQLQQGNPAAVGAGLALAAGQLVGKSLSRMHGIKDPEVEQVEKAQQVAETLKGITGNTPSEYLSNASKAVENLQPQLAAMLRLKAMQAGFEESMQERATAADELRARAAMFGASTSTPDAAYFAPDTQVIVLHPVTKIPVRAPIMRPKGELPYYVIDGKRYPLESLEVVTTVPGVGSAARQQQGQAHGDEAAVLTNQIERIDQALSNAGDTGNKAVENLYNDLGLEGGTDSFLGIEYLSKKKMREGLNALRSQLERQRQNLTLGDREAFQQGVPSTTSSGEGDGPWNYSAPDPRADPKNWR